MKTVKLDGCAVKFDDSDETKERVFEALIAWYLKQEAFSGEGIMQNDGPNEDAPVILSEIADDIIGFEVEWE